VQVAACDPRHTLLSLSRAQRHEQAAFVDLYIFEDSAESLARHMLLTAIFLDPSMDSLRRAQTFLEVYGNALIRESTAAYLRTLLKDLESIYEGACPHIAALFDFSALKYHDKDDLTAAFSMMRKHASYDMGKAWDHRCRKWLGDRYDVRRNMVSTVTKGVPGVGGVQACLFFTSDRSK
jgi:dynein assembly factor 3, axonemal